MYELCDIREERGIAIKIRQDDYEVEDEKKDALVPKLVYNIMHVSSKHCYSIKVE